MRVHLKDALSLGLETAYFISDRVVNTSIDRMLAGLSRSTSVFSLDDDEWFYKLINNRLYISDTSEYDWGQRTTHESLEYYATNTGLKTITGLRNALKDLRMGGNLGNKYTNEDYLGSFDTTTYPNIQDSPIGDYLGNLLPFVEELVELAYLLTLEQYVHTLVVIGDMTGLRDKLSTRPRNYQLLTKHLETKSSYYQEDELFKELIESYKGKVGGPSTHTVVGILVKHLPSHSSTHRPDMESVIPTEAGLAKLEQYNQYLREVLNQGLTN